MQQIGLWACDGSGKKGGIALARQGRTVRLVVGLAVSATVILGLVHCDLYGGAGFDSEFCAKVKGEAVKGFSCDDFASALKYVDDQGMVDYKGLKSNRARLDGFCRLVADLKTDEFDKWNRQEQIAVWTNVYNAVTLKAIIDNYPIKAGLLRSLAYPKNSIRQLPGVWDKWQFLVMGKRMTSCFRSLQKGMIRYSAEKERQATCVILFRPTRSESLPKTWQKIAYKSLFTDAIAPITDEEAPSLLAKAVAPNVILLVPMSISMAARYIKFLRRDIKYPIPFQAVCAICEVFQLRRPYYSIYCENSIRIFIFGFRY